MYPAKSRPKEVGELRQVGWVLAILLGESGSWVTMAVAGIQPEPVQGPRDSDGREGLRKGPVTLMAGSSQT